MTDWLTLGRFQQHKRFDWFVQLKIQSSRYLRRWRTSKRMKAHTYQVARLCTCKIRIDQRDMKLKKARSTQTHSVSHRYQNLARKGQRDGPIQNYWLGLVSFVDLLPRCLIGRNFGVPSTRLNRCREGHRCGNIRMRVLQQYGQSQDCW